MTNTEQTVGQIERRTQNRVVSLFQERLGYEYLGNWEDREGNSNIEEEILIEYLSSQGHSKTLIDKALFEFKQTAENQSKGLYYANREVYDLLRYGVKVKEDVGENKQ